MNHKEQQLLRTNWRDEARASVAQAKAEEQERPAEDRKAVAKQLFVRERAAELLQLEFLNSTEADKKRWWIDKLTLGNRMYSAGREDVSIIAPRFESWPAEAVPGWLRERFHQEQWLWNALALPVQEAIRGIKATISAIYEEARASGLDTDDPVVRRQLSPRIQNAVKSADYASLREIESQRSLVFEAAEWLRKQAPQGRRKPRKEQAPVETETWTTANWNFAREIAKLPAYLQRIVAERISACQKARRTKREAGAAGRWLQGYPRPDLDDRADEGGIDLYFNGQNLDWSGGEMKNTYVLISAPCNPPGHHGPRGGTYRRRREMRTVTIREPESPANRCTLNVLFHAVPAGARVKGCKLRAEKDGRGKLRWFFIPQFELPLPSAAPVRDVEGGASERAFIGVDLGWRKENEQEFAVAHSWDEKHGYRRWTLCIPNNRWARRWNSQKNRSSLADRGFPIELTPEGVRDFASRRGALLRDFKTRVGEQLRSTGLPSNWDRVGRRGIARMFTDEKSLQFAVLKGIRTDYEEWLKLDTELGRVYRTGWAMLTDNLDRQRREIAREILDGVTDIGIEDLNLKEMAEAENQGGTNWQRHIENIRNRSRQMTGPGSFITILTNMARKTGKRVHFLNPWRTSRRCSDCGHENNPGSVEMYECMQCGRRWNRDENAARNLKRLARECSGDDGTHRRCSRDGKHKRFHGFAGAEAALAQRTRNRRGEVLANRGLTGPVAVG